MQKIEDPESLVIEIGSMMMKAGFSGDNAPRCVFPSIIGRPEKISKPLMIGIGRSEQIVGDEAMAKRGLYLPSYPFNNGEVEDWDGFERIIHHMYYNELRVSPEEHYSFLSCNKPKDDSTGAKMIRILFETYNVEGVYYHNVPGLLSMLASQIKLPEKKESYTGLVLDCGETQSHCVCVYEGRFLPQTFQQSQVGGRDITKYLIQMLKEEQEIDFSKYSWQHEVCREMKEKLCFVSKEDSSFSSSYEETTVYELIDGRKIKVSQQQRSKTTELLFQPRIFQKCKGSMGVVDLIQESIAQCPYEVNKQEIYGNIILSGGSTFYEGFVERLENEMKRVSSGYDVKINVPAERKYSCWIGGSIMSSLKSFQEFWISRDLWDDLGDSSIKRCCQNLFL